MHVISLPMIFIFLSYERKEASVGVTTVASSTASRSGIQRSHDGSFVRTTYSGKGWACDTTGVDQDNFVHGRWTRMVDVPHVGE